MELLTTLFPGIGTMLAQEPAIAIARIVLIVAGFILPSSWSPWGWA